ncbi:MAG: hypothetical protein R3305_00185 [Gammaproteobacteria bacterium]|nr:hypothetical protein [Gammaproteobacteria bacterium]
MDELLLQPEREIGDEGFSETVVGALPARRNLRVSARRWTLGGAADAGSLVTALLGAPIEAVFSSFALGGGAATTVAAALLVATVVAVPVAWVFYSK